MSDHIVQDTSLTAVADAIRAKTGKSDPMIFPAGFVSEIGSISGGGGGGGEISGGDVNFFDYDGTLVASYRASDFANLSAMPENPSHTGLVAQGWNWSLANAKAYVAKYGKLHVGQMYATDDGKTRIYIHLEKGRTSPVLGICANGTVDVDWGDGTTHDTLTGSDLINIVYTSAHNYSAPGDYVIKLTTGGQIGFSGERASDAGSWILRGASSSNPINNSYRNAVKKIECGEHIVTIGSYAFSYCRAISSITISDSVTSIENRAFNYCNSLSSISIPDSVASINTDVFYYCRSLSRISIPDSVTSIGSSALGGCSSLYSISIPDSVTSIGSSAFGGCSSLYSISIPDSVTSIGSGAFANCSSLSRISIPDSVTSIGSGAFSNCSSLSGMSIPDSVTSIVDSAFGGCQSLSGISIPDSVTSIEASAFSGCYSLSGISIPDRVTSIGNSAFSSCYSLASLSIPDSVTSIGSYTFNSCYSIKEFHFLSSIPPTLASTDAFTSIPTDCIFYIPAGSLNAYQTASNWSSFASRFVEESA